MDIETLANRKLDFADVSKVSLRDMYMRICACRDFEISHVWQRAIFLTAFLLGCFTAYGAVCSMLTDENHKFVYAWYLNVAAFGVSLVGVIVSLFWIMMAKGSKAWYELYESAIGAFSVKYPAGCDNVALSLSQHNWRKLICEAHAIDDVIKEESRSRCIFSLKGGPYSVSKINVAIGILAFVIWVSLAAVHIIVAVRYSVHDSKLSALHHQENCYRSNNDVGGIATRCRCAPVCVRQMVQEWIFKQIRMASRQRRIGTK